MIARPAALQALLDHHDALRAKLTTTAGVWRLEVLPVGAVSRRAIQTRRDGLRSRGRDHGAGRVRRGELVVLGVHHLVVDGVSLRILAEDFEAAIAGEPLAPVGHLVPALGAGPSTLANQPERVAELPQWLDILDTPDPLIGDQDLSPRRDLVSTAQHGQHDAAARSRPCR